MLLKAAVREFLQVVLLVSDVTLVYFGSRGTGVLQPFLHNNQSAH